MTQENTGKVMENAISQALIKPEDITPLTQPEALELLEQTVKQFLHMIQTGLHLGKQTILAHHNTLTMRHITCRDPVKNLCLPMLL